MSLCPVYLFTPVIQVGQATSLHFTPRNKNGLEIKRSLLRSNKEVSGRAIKRIQSCCFFPYLKPPLCHQTFDLVLELQNRNENYSSPFLILKFIIQNLFTRLSKFHSPGASSTDHKLVLGLCCKICIYQETIWILTMFSLK